MALPAPHGAPHVARLFRWLALACAVVSVGPRARAQVPTAPTTQVSARVESYVDDDSTVVWRPRASARVAVNDHWEVMPTFMVDAVSTASVDIVSHASRRVVEQRYEPTLTVTRYGDRGRSTMLTYGYGHEPDYQSHQGSVTVGADLGAARLVHVQGRLQLVHGIVGSVGDPTFERHVTTAYAAGTVSRIVGPGTVVRFGLELAEVHGFQSSAYRTVRIGPWTATRGDGTDPDQGSWVFQGVTATVFERHPDDRLRARAAFDLAQAIRGPWAVYANVAAYRDTWAITAGEGTLELRIEPRSDLLVRFGARAYVQSGAWFWRARYEDANGVDGYVSDDKESGPMRSYTAHGAVTVPVRSFRVDLRVEGTHYAYPEYTLLPEKNALAFQLGLTYRR